MGITHKWKNKELIIGQNEESICIHQTDAASGIVKLSAGLRQRQSASTVCCVSIL